MNAIPHVVTSPEPLALPAPSSLMKAHVQHQNTMIGERLSQKQATLLFEWLLARRQYWLGESTWMLARHASLNLQMPVSEAVVRQMRSIIQAYVSIES
jgi:hypothetical protein